MQAILEAARDAGLMDGDASYGNDCIADAATTVFTTNANGGTSVVSAYALDVGEPAGSCGSEDEADERAALAEFQAALGDLSSWLPEGSVGQEQPLDPSELRVYRHLPGQEPRADPSPRWTRSRGRSAYRSDRSATGSPTTAPMPCGVVDGDDLSTLLPSPDRRTRSRRGRATAASTS